MNINFWLYVVMILVSFCAVVLTYEDYKKALTSDDKIRINKNKKDLEEAKAIFIISIVCFILGIFVS